MATKSDKSLAEKQRKQKIVLAVGGVVLLAVLALQGPKLLKQVRGSSSTPARTATAAATPGVTTPAEPGTAIAVPASGVVKAGKGTAQLAGIVIAPAATPSPTQGQLWSFSRFKAKDPFVQQVKDTSTASSGSTAASGSSSSKTPASGGGGGTQGSAPTAAPLAYATLLVNGRPQVIALGDAFPKSDKIFVLAKLVGKTARIGVAGGAFTDGKTLQLELGKPVTLMNTTTGQRYVVKLVYVGSQPETIASFKGGKVAAAAASATSTP